jgi:hypothetical protein
MSWITPQKIVLDMNNFDVDVLMELEKNRMDLG